MKIHFIPTILAVLTFIVATPQTYALFGHVAIEKQRTQAAERQLTQEQQANGQLAHTNGQLLSTNGQLQDTNQRLHNVVTALAAAVAVALVLGAMIGTYTRRNAHQP